MLGRCLKIAFDKTRVIHSLPLSNPINNCVVKLMEIDMTGKVFENVGKDKQTRIWSSKVARDLIDLLGILIL